MKKREKMMRIEEVRRDKMRGRNHAFFFNGFMEVSIDGNIKSLDQICAFGDEEFGGFLEVRFVDFVEDLMRLGIWESEKREKGDLVVCKEKRNLWS